ncbi:MAG: prolipoprotein diacylglyceryl transferase [Clostridia bacterium]|nr:prolipoprotein diacylglyceryl transferase [Clostridia bacterium]
MALDPIAFEIGPIAVRWYGILISTGVALGILLAYKECIRQGIDPDYILTISIFALPAAFIGARLYYVIFRWGEYYRFHPEEIIAIWHGGLAIHGGVIGGVLAGYFVVRKYKLNFWKMADIVAPSIILGQAIGRWGNYFNQEAYGYPTDLPWAMFIDGAYRHPTFLYEFIWNMGVFAYLIFRRYQPGVKQGELFTSYFILYSLGRIVIESFRTDSLMIGPLRVAQVISLGLIAVGVLILYFKVRNAPRYNVK